jgi:hypothetical protein
MGAAFLPISSDVFFYWVDWTAIYPVTGRFISRESGYTTGPKRTVTVRQTIC